VLVLDRGLISGSGDAFDREPVAPARVWSPEWDSLAGLAVSPFRPRDPWAKANSRRRDEIVASLATALVAVHVRPGGILESIARAALQSGMWVGLWDDDNAGPAAALAGDGSPVAAPLPASMGLDAITRSIAEQARLGCRGGEIGAGRGRSARRWSDRERDFLYDLLELACRRPLDDSRLLEFVDGGRTLGSAAPAAL